MEGNVRNQSADRSTPTAPTRDIDQILQRRRRRERHSDHQFPPDILHGSIAIGAVYERLGRRWPETTAFLDVALDSRGQVQGWSLAQFNDHFLTIQHVDADELTDPVQWVTAQASACARILVRTGHDGVSERHSTKLDSRSDAAVTKLPCSTELLRSLESRHLNVTRDFSLRADQHVSASETAFRASRVNLLSIIGLCSVWAG